MAIKITLVYPSPTRHTSPPLGVAYIAAVLRDNGYSVNIIDFNDVKDDADFKARIISYKPDIVGFSVQTNFAEFSFKYAQMVKENLHGAFIVLGGPHPSVLPEDTLNHKFIDAIAIGEAEYTFLDLARAIENNTPLKNVKGIWYKTKEGKVVRNERREFIQNLDELPMPARDLLPMEIYLKNIPISPLPMPFTHLMANRGCPYSCKFCQPTSHTMFGLKLRYRGYVKVVDELEYLIEKYKINSINIGGDTLTVDKKWVIGLCEELRKRKIDIPWTAGVRADTVNYDILSHMKKAGCLLVQMGVESGSQKILNDINKRITVQQVRDCFKWLNQLGIVSSANFMLGNLTETRETMEESLQFMKSLNLDSLSVFITNPLPGTNLYDEALNAGLIKVKGFNDLSRHHLGSLKLKNITDKDIDEYRDKFYKEYLKLKLSYLYNPILVYKKRYLHYALLKRLVSLRHMDINAIKKSYIHLNTTKKNPLSKVYEMMIKSF